LLCSVKSWRCARLAARFPLWLRADRFAEEDRFPRHECLAPPARGVISSPATTTWLMRFKLRGNGWIVALAAVDHNGPFGTVFDHSPHSMWPLKLNKTRGWQDT